MTGADAETIRDLGTEVIGVGLGTDMGYSNLRLDPALPSYLLRELNQADQEHLRARWAKEMVQLIGFLIHNGSRMSHSPRGVTLLELPNMLAVLAWLQETAFPEQVVRVALRGSPPRHLDCPHALTQATAIRVQAAQALAGVESYPL